MYHQDEVSDTLLMPLNHGYSSLSSYILPHRFALIFRSKWRCIRMEMKRVLFCLTPLEQIDRRGLKTG